MQGTGISTGVGSPNHKGHSNAWKDFSQNPEKKVFRSRQNRYGIYFEIKNRSVVRCAVTTGKLVCTEIASFVGEEWSLEMLIQISPEEQKRVYNFINSLPVIDWENYKSKIDGTSFREQLHNINCKKLFRRLRQRNRPKKKERERLKLRREAIKLY